MNKLDLKTEDGRGIEFSTLWDGKILVEINIPNEVVEPGDTTYMLVTLTVDQMRSIALWWSRVDPGDG